MDLINLPSTCKVRSKLIYLIQKLKKQKGYVLYHTRRGRPTVVNNTDREKIIETLMLTAAEACQKCQIFSKVVVDTKRRQGTRGADANPEICRNTRHRLLSDSNIRKLAPQILTDARRKACECIRISYIWSCLLFAYRINLPAVQKWNTDATIISVCYIRRCLNNPCGVI